MTDLPPPHIHKTEASVHQWLTDRWTGPIVLAVSAIAMLHWTWGRYCHPFIDFGREIYVAWRLSAGDVLYRDIDYFNGPISPYLNALIFRCFGTSLLTLEIANLLWWAFLVVMAYRLYVAMSDRLSAFVASLLFIAFFSFLQLTPSGNYNFITPYAHEATHSLTCAFAALTLLWSYLREPGRPSLRALVGIGLLLGTMFLMKAEVTIATAAAIATGVGLRLFLGGARFKQWIGTVAIIMAAAVVPSIIAFALLRLAMPSREAMFGLLGSWKYLFDARLTNNPFYRRLMGTDRLWHNTVVMLQVLGGELLLLSPPAIAAVLVRRNASNEGRWVCAAGSVGYIIAILWIFWDQANWEGALRPLNLIVVAMALTFAILNLRGRKPYSPRRILQLSFCIFAAALFLKIFFNIGAFRYGFTLAGPAFAVMVMLLVRWIPGAIRRAGGSAWVFRGPAIAVLGCLSLRYLTAYQHFYRSQPAPTVGIGDDQFGVYQNAEAINLALSFLARLPRDQTVATVPQGAMINYLSRRVNPTGELTLLPGEVEMFGQQRILRRFETHPPDWILGVQTDVSAFGYAGFGLDYAQDIARFIKENYDPVPLSKSKNLRSNLQFLKLVPGHRLIGASAAIPQTQSSERSLAARSLPEAGEDASRPR